MTVTEAPLVSILIHTYNRKKLLTLSIESALAQTFTNFELVIVDNASDDGAWEVCQEFAVRDPRVRIFQNEINLGAGFNALRGLMECQGKYVKVLYSDDLISPDFLEKTLPLIENPDVGFVFTAVEMGVERATNNNIYYRIEDRPGTMSSQEFIYYSIFQQGEIVPNYPGAGLFRLEDMRQHVLMKVPSPEINDYHEHGMGVESLLFLITAHKYPLVAYVPEALSFYRYHSESETLSSLANRPEKWWFCYQQVKIWFAHHYKYDRILNCLLACEWLHQKSDVEPRSFDEVAARYLFDYPKIVRNNEDETISTLRHVRTCIAEFWLDVSPEFLEKICLFKTFLKHVQITKYHSLVTSSEVRYLEKTAADRIFADKVSSTISKGFSHPQAMNHLIVGMLYSYPQDLELSYDWNSIPEWFLDSYIKFLFHLPPQASTIGSAARQSDYLHNLIERFHQDIFDPNTSPLISHKLATGLVNYFDLSGLHLTDRPVQDLYDRQGNIVDFVLNNIDAKIDYKFPSRSVQRDRIRIGILKIDFGSNKETAMALPWFEHLDRAKFEVILYALDKSDCAVSDYCRSRVDDLIIPPTDLSVPERVAAIRADDLDILIVANDITISANQIALLAHHRLARIQLTYNCNPTPTGIPNLDYYVTGNLIPSVNHLQSIDREQLIAIDGCGCLSWAGDLEMVNVPLDRQLLGIAPDAIVYISGANAIKITAELVTNWAKIIAAVPNSVLVLYPFGHSHPVAAFSAMIKQIFTDFDINSNRLFILNFQGRANVLNCLKIGDVYLDSYPYTGFASLIDALQVGLPPVVRVGDAWISQRGAGLLDSIEARNLITDSEDSYIELAVNLGQNLSSRQEYTTHIIQKMQRPSFLDSHGFGKQVENLIQELFTRYQQSTPDTDIDLEKIKFVAFPDWNRAEEDVCNELRVMMHRLCLLEQSNPISLLLATDNLEDLEHGNFILAAAGMELMMTENIDVNDYFDISLLDRLSPMQWSELLPQLQGKISLSLEDTSAIDIARANTLDRLDLVDYLTLAKKATQRNIPALKLNIELTSLKDIVDYAAL